jgi:hypothetical protein
MVAVAPPVLSHQTPDLARRAGLGDRFFYWRGVSGRRYLFSAVPAESLADFRSAVVILAEPAGDGRLAAAAIVVLDARGRPTEGEAWPPVLPHRTRALVHFLAATDADRRRLVSDLTASAFKLAA